MSKKFLSLTVAAFFMAASILMTGCFKQEQTNSTSVNSASVNEEKAATAELIINDGSGNKQTTVVLDGEAMTALQILRQGAAKLDLELQTKEYEFGTAVEGIGGKIGGAEGKYWLYYINGQMANVGVDAQAVQAGDKLEFKYEKSDF